MKYKMIDNMLILKLTNYILKIIKNKTFIFFERFILIYKYNFLFYLLIKYLSPSIFYIFCNYYILIN